VVSFRNEPVKVLERSETAINVDVIADVIAEIAHWRGVDW
jgi:hypothetical protein